MIIGIREGKSYRQVRMQKCRQEIGVLGCRILLIEHQGVITLRTPSNISCSEMRAQEGVTSILYDRHGNTAAMYFYTFDTGFDSYRKYDLNEEITIGSSIEDDIHIRSADLNAAEIRIHPAESTLIFQRDDIPCDCVFLSLQKTYHPGDSLSVCNCRIFFLPDGIMINRCSNITVGLPAYTREKDDLKPLSERAEHHVSGCHENEIEPGIRIRLEPPQQLFEESVSRSLIAMMGPAFLMSSASLTAGMISAYRAYMNGREMIDSLPLLLMPCVMMISTLLFQPLNAFLEKKRLRIRREKQLQEYRFYLNHVLSVIELSYKKYLETCRMQFSKDLKDIPIDLADSFPYLRIGSSAAGFQVIIEEKSNGLSLKYSKMINAMKDQIDIREDTPLLISLAEYALISIHSKYMEDTAVYLILQTAMRTDYRIMILADETFLIERPWLRRLPQTFDQGIRMLFSEEALLHEMLHRVTGKAVCFLLRSCNLVFDTSRIHVIDFVRDRSDAELLIDEDGEMVWDRKKHQHCRYSFDHFVPVDFTNLVGRLPACEYEKHVPNDFLTLHNLNHARSSDVLEKWRQADINHALICNLGISQDGDLIHLDLHEKKDGPHCLIAGMTGSGKSELIINLILSYAVQYAPYDLQFALIDFKGGGASQVLMKKGLELPHIVGTLTNLDGENMDKALYSFRSECIRREGLIASMNESISEPVMNLADYRRVWKKDCGLPRLADLIIIVDEFAELKLEMPDFLNDLISISRIGRSLGIHLILATQKPSGVINDQIWSNCSSKICLKVAEKQDSQEVLHASDASDLRHAGEFCLLHESGMVKGQSGYANARQSLSRTHLEILGNDAGILKDSDEYTGRSEPQLNRILSLIYEAFQKEEPCMPLWLDPLPERKWNASLCGLVIGQADLYEEHRYADVLIEKNNASLFVCSERKAKQCLSNTVLCTLFSNLHESDLIFVIDDLHLIQEDIRPAGVLTDVFSSCYQEKMINLIQMIRNGRMQDKRTFLLITDLTRFYESSDQSAHYLHDLIEHREEYHLTLILFASSVSVISYRTLNLISKRFTLKIDRMNEVQQLFETSSRKVQKKEGFGLLKHGNLFEWRIDVTDDITLKRMYLQMLARAGKQVSLVIPCMPEKVSLRNAVCQGIPLGISERSYAWVSVERGLPLYVVSTHAYETENYQKILSLYFDIPGDLCFMILEEYRRIRDAHDWVLYVGKGYGEQYVFHSRWHSLRADQAILFHEKESEMIRIAEE